MVSSWIDNAEMENLESIDYVGGRGEESHKEENAVSEESQRVIEPQYF